MKCFHNKRGYCKECEKELEYCRKNGWGESYEHQLNQRKYLSGLVEEATKACNDTRNEMDRQNKKHRGVIAWLLGR